MNRAIERPLGGPILAGGGLAVLALAGLAMAFVAVRLFAEVGPVSAMSDRYAWGIWKPLNVVAFTGVGAGALALALVGYVANRGRSHPLVRSSVLVGAITYALAGFSVIVDLDEWWNAWALFMHPSSLGALFLVAPATLHPLWNGAWLPALFLLSCLTMGAGAVIVVDTITHLAWRRARDLSLDSTLALVMAACSLAFVALRLGDVLAAGELGFVHGPKGLLFVVEMALFLYPALRVLAPSYRRNPGYLFWASQLALAAGALYRFDTYLAAFDTGPGFGYFPSLGEILFSLGLAGIGLAMCVVAVQRLPVLAGRAPTRPARAA